MYHVSYVIPRYVENRGRGSIMDENALDKRSNVYIEAYLVSLSSMFSVPMPRCRGGFLIPDVSLDYDQG